MASMEAALDRGRRLWRCDACGKVNAWDWEDASEAEDWLNESVAVSYGSAFDNTCGHCRTDWVRWDSPFLAETYTHIPWEG